MSILFGVENYRNGLVCFCLVGFPLLTRAEDERELLSLVQSQHQSSREAVYSLSCSVKLERGYPTTEAVEEGKYWRSFGRARLWEAYATTMVDHFYLIPEGELRQVIRQRPTQEQSGWRTRRELINSQIRLLDVWRFMLLGFVEQLAQAKDVPRAKRERVEGRDCIRVTMTLPGHQSQSTTGPDIQLTFWLDAGRNYLVWKQVETGREFHREWQVQEWVEPQPGVFFPTKLVGKGFRGSTQYSQGSYTLSNVRINEPIAKSIFELPEVPNGTLCDDLIRKQTYPIDATWQQLPGGETRPYDIIAIPYTTSSQSGFASQSLKEPGDWTSWIWPGSLAVLAIAGAIWLYRRYRPRAIRT